MENLELNERYDEYKTNIEARIAAGEKVTLVPKDKWIRTVEIPDTEKPGKMKKVRLPGVTGETPIQRGSRVAEVRMSKVMDSLDRLEQATSSAYGYTPEQVDKLVAALKENTDRIIAKFEAKKSEPTKDKPAEKKKFQF
jgi:hypothetical protein